MRPGEGNKKASITSVFTSGLGRDTQNLILQKTHESKPKTLSSFVGAKTIKTNSNKRLEKTEKIKIATDLQKINQGERNDFLKTGPIMSLEARQAQT